MILRFGTENFRSIGEYQEILFTSSAKNNEDAYLLTPKGIREKVLPTTSIYGANGSGKTNLLLALRFTLSGIRLSANKDFEYADIPTFRLDKKYTEKPSSFDIDFVFDGTHYHYGFSVQNNLVASEWLYSFTYTSRASRSVLFHREAPGSSSEYHFGKNLKGKNKSIAAITGESSLFLSVAAKSNHATLHNISEYFKNNYNFRFKADLSENKIGSKIFKYGIEAQISSFLSLIDIGASKLSITKEELNDERKQFQESFHHALKTTLQDSEIDLELQSLPDQEHLIHIQRKDNDSQNIKFKFSEESLGTKALISLLASVFWVLKHGGVFVVDELESSLHTLLSLRVVELFRNKETNPQGAQLIFSTHETQLLHPAKVLQDEVWLTEKCRNGGTQVRPLSEYSTSKKTNIQSRYLEGRFGAIPFLEPTDNSNLFETEDET